MDYAREARLDPGMTRVFREVIRALDEEYTKFNKENRRIRNANRPSPSAKQRLRGSRG